MINLPFLLFLKFLWVLVKLLSPTYNVFFFNRRNFQINLHFQAIFIPNRVFMSQQDKHDRLLCVNGLSPPIPWVFEITRNKPFSPSVLKYWGYVLTTTRLKLLLQCNAFIWASLLCYQMYFLAQSKNIQKCNGFLL